MNQSMLQDSFEYSIQGDTECEPLGTHTSFATNPSSYDNESSPAIFRPASLSSLSQSSMNPLSIHNANGYDYRAPPSAMNHHEPPFQARSGISSRGSSSASPSSSNSTYGILPGSSPQYSVNANVSFHPGSRSNLPTTAVYSSIASYPSQSSLQSSLETRPRLTSISSASGMPPPPRTTAFPSSVSPPLGSSYRQELPSTISQLSRNALSNHGGLFQLPPSPQSSLSTMSRSLESSVGRESPNNQQYGFAAPMQLEANPSLTAGSQSVPPFSATQTFYSLSDGRGNSVQADIQAKIDKGFFRADQDWTCYRRNYFSVVCSYSLRSDADVNPDQLCIHKPGSSPQRVVSFAMCIAAKVDGEEGKAIELVQHTPKRDKGPMGVPEKKDLKPNPSGNLGTFQGTSGFSPNSSLSNDYDRVYSTLHESQTVANFERIQFKKATANNGKRRAAQQYFHIVVELYAKVNRGNGPETELVKFAQRVSAQMVVRGRSPGHYQDERRGSSTSMGPGSGGGGGSPGDFSSIHRDTSIGGHSSSSLGGLAGPSSYARLGGAYQGHHASMVLSPPSNSHHSVPSTTSASSFASNSAFLSGSPSQHHSHSHAHSHSHSHSVHHLEQQNSGGLDAYYQGQGQADRYEHSGTPRSNPTSGNSPGNLHESSLFDYLTPSMVKEELKMPSIKPTPSSSGARFPNMSYPFLSPTFGGNNWHGLDGYGPPKDCKQPLLIDSPHKSYFSEMSAL